MFKRMTGKTRYRTGLFGRMILQVEVEEFDEHPLGFDTYFKWRDAGVEDLQEIQEIKHRECRSLIEVLRHRSVITPEMCAKMTEALKRI